MSLIEVLVYIAIISSFLVSAVFSAYSVFMSISHDDFLVSKASSVELDTHFSAHTEQRGFVALISAIIISMTLLVAAVGFSGHVATLFDLVMRQEYRMVARGSAHTCFAFAIARSSSDFGYQSGGEAYTPFSCSILNVTAPTFETRHIVTTAVYKGITARVEGEIELHSNFIKILYENLIIF